MLSSVKATYSLYFRYYLNVKKDKEKIQKVFLHEGDPECL